jgi:hypothetical protein
MQIQRCMLINAYTYIHINMFMHAFPDFPGNECLTSDHTEMLIHKYIYACEYTCMYNLKCMCMQDYLSCLSLYIYIHTYIYIYIYIYITYLPRIPSKWGSSSRSYLSRYSNSSSVPKTYIHIYIYIYVNIHHVYVSWAWLFFVCTCVYIHICMQIYIYTCIYICIDVYRYAYIHMYIWIQILNHQLIKCRSKAYFGYFD